MVGAAREEPQEWQQRNLGLFSLGQRHPRGSHSSHCLLGCREEMPPAALRRGKARGGETEGVK